MDKLVLELLMERHQGEVYRYLTYLGADRDEAEDVVQETFLAAFKSRTFPDDGNPRRESGWLRGTARNLLYMHFEKNARHRKAIDGAILDRAEKIWTDEFLRDGDGFDYMEALRKCIEGLPPRQSEALDMRYKRKMSRMDMARTLSMTGDGIKSLLRRIRIALRKCILERLGLGEENLS